MFHYNLFGWFCLIEDRTIDRTKISFYWRPLFGFLGCGGWRRFGAHGLTAYFNGRTPDLEDIFPYGGAIPDVSHAWR